MTVVEHSTVGAGELDEGMQKVAWLLVFVEQGVDRHQDRQRLTVGATAEDFLLPGMRQARCCVSGDRQL